MALSNQTQALNQHTEVLNKIEELATEGRVPEAITQLRDYLTTKKDYDSLARLSSLEGNYNRMLDYFLTGNPDPLRRSMHSKTVAEILSMTADCRRAIRVEEGSDLFATKARFENLQHQTLSQRLDAYRKTCLDYAVACIENPENVKSLRRMRDERLSLFFFKLWTDREIDEGNSAVISAIFSEKEGGFQLQAQVINALLLRCMEFFDSNVIMMLAEIAEKSRNEKITARAMTALILLMTRHRKKLEDNEMIRLRFALWQDDLMMYRRLREVVTALIRTRDTDRISDTMKSEVIPGLMKMRPEIMKKMRDITPDMDPSMMEENPEWEEMLNKNGLGDRLRELSELQSEGADVMMVAFSSLKNFPFFNDISNWLLPFDIEHSSLDSLRDLNLFGIEKLFSSPSMMMCDSDKYSFAFSLTSMPESQRQMALGQLDAQLSQLAEEHKEQLLKTSTPEFDRETNMYVRDLYRFFKLNPRHEEFADPFEKVADFTRLPVIGQILMQSDIIEIAGEFFFRHGYYREALRVFKDIEKERSQESDSGRYEKIGFCYQKLGDYDTALSYYDKASLLAPESSWLLKKRAFCTRQCGHFKTAAELYRQLIEKNPENVNMICSLADCLSAEGETEEALQLYYKADYLKPGNHKVERAIAWNELRNRRLEKSMNYHQRILAAEPEARDFMNAGHTAFLAGHPGEAVKHYRNAISKYGGRKAFETAMEADMETLLELGADNIELRLLINAV